MAMAFPVEFTRPMDVEYDNGDQAKRSFHSKYPSHVQATTSSPLCSFDYKLDVGSDGQVEPVCVLTFHKCITALKDYEHKSLEELRWEDYQIGRKTASKPISQPVARTTTTPSSATATTTLTLPVTLSSFNNPFARTLLAPQRRLPVVANPVQPQLNPNTSGTFLKFQPILGADIRDSRTGNGFSAMDTRLMSIVAMLEYERKSPEELRWEDYQCNRKSRPPFSMISPPPATKPAPPPPPKPVEKPPTASGDQTTTEIDALCPICLETIQDLKKQNKRLMVTICGHILCKVCATKLARTSKKIECPNCRKHLNEKDIHDLFL